MEWQPIETFFKRSDRTGSVLIYIPGYGVTTARCEFTSLHVWKSGERCFKGGDEADNLLLDKIKGCGPTHWMPLPPAPETD